MTFSPYKGITLQSWSVLKEKPLLGPKWNERDTYFVYFACASNCSPFTFSMEFVVSASIFISETTLFVNK